MRRWLVVGIVIVAGCGSAPEAVSGGSPVAPTIAVHSPEMEAVAVAVAVAEPPMPPAPPRCRLAPEGGQVLVARRSLVGLRLGPSGGVIVHGPEIHDSHGWSPDYPCDFNPGAIAFGVLTDVREIVAVQSGELCNDDRRDGDMVFADAGGEVSVLECGRLGRREPECALRAPFSPDVDGLAFTRPAGPVVFAAAARDGVLFAAGAPVGRGAVGWVVTHETHARGVLVRDLASLGRDANEFGPSVALTSATEARVLLTTAWDAFAVTMDLRARPVGAPTPAAEAAEAPSGRPPRELRDTIAAAAGERATIAANGAAWIGAWGTGDGTERHLRLARFGADGTLDGEVIDLSSAGRRAGSVEVATAAGRTVIAWDELGDDGWALRAAEVRCDDP